MPIIREYTEPDKNNWDIYVHNHPQATLYHLSGWKNVIEKRYGHKTYYLMATEEKLGSREAERLGSKKQLKAESSKLKRIQHTTSHSQHTTYNQQPTPAKPVGILPLVHIKHFLFGNSLISIPFFDYGGILADDRETEKALLTEAINLAKNIGANSIELRQINPINFYPACPVKRQPNGMRSLFHRDEACLSGGKFFQNSDGTCTPLEHLTGAINTINHSTKSDKARMLIDLPDSSEALMGSFKSKLRSQIKKPIKEGLKAKIGGAELLNNYFDVFSVNMRDLGSPVHSKKLMQNVLNEFSDQTRIVIIHKDGLPVACSLIIGFKDTLENPWASALREFSRLAPNMLLYWTMLENACDNGFREFDFGRSTPSEGTYKFKEQWGAKPEPLHWYYISLSEQPGNITTTDKSKFTKAIQYWRKLPVPVANILGPPIRKHIGL